MIKEIQNKKNVNMKKAAIENIFVWIVLFAMFATILFFIINYTVIIRAKDTMDALADYGANQVGNNGIGADLSNTMSSIATRNFDTINNADTNSICNRNADNQYMVIFSVTSSNTKLYFYNGQLNSTRVVFNQDGTGDTITCNLTVTINE